MCASEIGNPDEILDEVRLCAKAVGLEWGQVCELARFSKARGESLVEALVARSGVDERALLKGLSEALNITFTENQADTIPPEVLETISATLAARYTVIPLEKANGDLRVACWDPFDWEGWDELAHIVRAPMERVLCPRGVIEQMIRAHYGLGADTVDHLMSARETQGTQAAETSYAAVTDLAGEEAANEPTVVNFVNQVLAEAIRLNATDIHFEPYEEKYRIRYRIDGMLEDVPVPASLYAFKLAVVSRIKIMACLDITEKRLPQDGRAQVSMGNQKCDLRISILPGIHGEAIVIRIQNRQIVRLDFEALGFGEAERAKIDRLATCPYGLILVTGPTGSGKTTTLYTCLLKIRAPQIKIITIEDPVEYWMDGMLQMQMNQDVGFTFARALRSMLRHDPDVMLVGEVRDGETAEIAIRSALTGHLVLSTLHTNDAASAVTRLCDIGIEPFLLASCLRGIVAQRLVRRVCPECRAQIDPGTMDDFEIAALQAAGCGSGPTLWEARGCQACRFTGYQGRMVVAEIIGVTPSIRALIQAKAPAEQIKEQAVKDGMRTLRESALQAALSGRTTLREVLRVTQEDL